jgi:uncharacterized protein DUF927
MRAETRAALKALVDDHGEDNKAQRRRHKAEEQHEQAEQFLSFPPFTMDSKDGLFVALVRQPGTKKEWTEEIWLGAPFEIIGRVRDSQSHGWARLLQWKDDDGIVHRHPVADQDLHGDGAALCATLASGGLKIVTGSARQYFVTY